MVDKLERVYTIPLTKAYDAVRTKRARRAVNLLRSFLIRHMKSEQISISNALNSFMWQYSMQRPPRRVKVRAIREDGKVKAYLQDEKIEEKKEQKKEEPKKPDAKKDEKKPETKKEEPKKSEVKSNEQSTSEQKKQETKKHDKQAEEKKK